MSGVVVVMGMNGDRTRWDWHLEEEVVIVEVGEWFRVGSQSTE